MRRVALGDEDIGDETLLAGELRVCVHVSGQLRALLVPAALLAGEEALHNLTKISQQQILLAAVVVRVGINSVPIAGAGGGAALRRQRLDDVHASRVEMFLQRTRKERRALRAPLVYHY